ncbi:hypothetical protein H257_03329 [Aphanomyces astaci]|uniref:Peptidase M12A domain-containing protein n=1 Tax=Aphanomyces astaci TaxID=112090 RepID=W4GW48_APHAT|nr:hypothetical protein H257_03329 [Aphanomyces astaci]ETV83950.1 hypothetical protein H257_03329 [Aphanomyces astaci]|eukprot:XP_009825642.1 hypothetical protein H257_03329 [Aphanomyces astaci]
MRSSTIVVAVGALVSCQQLSTVSASSPTGHSNSVTTSSRSLRAHHHHHKPTTTTLPRPTHHKLRHSPSQPHTNPATAVDFALSCEFEGTSLRNRQTLQLTGSKGHKGRLYTVCLDGKVVCHEELGVADTPALVDMNCSAISPSRRLVYSPSGYRRRTVCYIIASNFTSSQRAQIDNAMSQFQDETTIRFLEVSACSVNVTMIGGKAICGNCLNYANINNWDAGCYAAVGFQNADPQVLNLNAACFDDLTGTGRVVHEVSCLTTRYRAHSHPERKVIVIPVELKVSRNNYQVFTTAVKLFKNDPASIMHYGSTAASIQYCLVSQSPDQDNCILPTRDACDEKGSEVLGQRMKLSPLDLESVVQLYGNVTTRQRCIELGHKECPCEEGRGQPNSTPPSPATSSNGFFRFLAELTRWFA